MGQARKASSIHKIPRSDDSPTMKLSFFLLRKYAISSQNSGITSYPTMHTHLHANQLNKGFNASVGTMNCGCVMS